MGQTKLSTIHPDDTSLQMVRVRTGFLDLKKINQESSVKDYAVDKFIFNSYCQEALQKEKEKLGLKAADYVRKRRSLDSENITNATDFDYVRKRRSIDSENRTNVMDYLQDDNGEILDRVRRQNQKPGKDKKKKKEKKKKKKKR